MGFIGQLLMNRGLQIEKAGPAALMRNLDIVLAFIYQITILHITPTPWSIAGAVLILTCTSIVGIAKARKSQQSNLSNAKLPDDKNGEVELTEGRRR